MAAKKILVVNPEKSARVLPIDLAKRILPAVKKAVDEKKLNGNLGSVGTDLLSSAISKKFKEARNVKLGDDEFNDYLKKIRENTSFIGAMGSYYWHKPDEILDKKTNATHQLYVSHREGLENRLLALKAAERLMKRMAKSGIIAKAKSLNPEFQANDAIIVYFNGARMKFDDLQKMVRESIKGSESAFAKEAYPLSTQVINEIGGIGVSRSASDKTSLTQIVSKAIAEEIALFAQKNHRKPNEKELKELIVRAAQEIAPKCGW